MSTPIRTMSAADRLNTGLAHQEAMNAKTKKEKDKKRKRQSGESEVTSVMDIGVQSTQSQDGSANIQPSAFSSLKNVPSTPKNQGGAASFSNVEPSSLADAEVDSSDVEEDKAARKKRKREKRATRKAAKKAKLEGTSSYGWQTSLGTFPEYDGSDALATGPRYVPGPTTPSPKSKKAVASITMSVTKANKADALMQTILKGSNHERTSSNPVAIAERIQTSEVITTTETNAKKSRKSRAENKNRKVTDATEEESLSQTIESIKKESTAKIEALFPRIPSASDFSNIPDRRAEDAVYMAAIDPKRAKITLEQWEKKSGKVRGIVGGSRPDEEPEENVAFSASYIANQPGGIHLGNINFNVITLTTGQEHDFEVQNAAKSKRIISVAGGKANVWLGALDFVIGARGMWRVRAGETCIVKNKGGEQVTLHVTSMQ